MLCPICMASRKLFSSTRLTRGVNERWPDTSAPSSMEATSRMPFTTAS